MGHRDIQAMHTWSIYDDYNLKAMFKYCKLQANTNLIQLYIARINYRRTIRFRIIKFA